MGGMSTAKGRATTSKFCKGDIRPRGQWPKYRGRRLKRRVPTKGFASSVPTPPPPSWGPRRSPAKRVRWGEGGAKERNVVFGFSRKRNGADFAPTRGPGPQARRSLVTFHRWKVTRRRRDQKTKITRVTRKRQKRNPKQPRKPLQATLVSPQESAWKQPKQSPFPPTEYTTPSLRS